MKLKRILAGALSIIMTASVAVSAEFSDVASDAWYYDYVNYVSEKGVMNGYNGEFRPSAVTTRGEYVLALYNAAGASEISGKSSFADVSEDAEYSKAVFWAEKYKIASGTGDGKFAPEDSLTREMAMTFLFRALGALRIEVQSVAEDMISSFKDGASVSEWAESAMNTLINMQVINGTNEGMLNPQGKLINCEVAAMLYRALNRERYVYETGEDEYYYDENEEEFFDDGYMGEEIFEDEEMFDEFYGEEEEFFGEEE